MIFVNAAPKQQPRLEAGGWFSRSFASASGVLLAVLALLIGVPVVGIMLVCGGCLTITGSALNEVAELEKAEDAKGIAQAKKALAKYGYIGAMSNDAKRRFSIEPDATDVIYGSIRTPDGVQDFEVAYHVATFGNDEVWTLKRITVGTETVFQARN